MTLLEQREIEAKIVAPLFEAFAQVLGRERAKAILRHQIETLARQAGKAFAETQEKPNLEHLANILPRWTAGGALELHVIEQSAERLSFDVQRCQYAEMYNRLGLSELGEILSCCRDAAFVEGYHSEIQYERKQTILGGATQCDFRFQEKKPSC